MDFGRSIYDGGLIIMNLTDEQKKILKHCRDTYGDTAQILVSIEELNELACVLAKYPRYDSPIKAVEELKDKALDEVADVFIVLDHIVNILQLTDDEVAARIDKKIQRVTRWLDTNDKFSQTLVDRTVE